MLYLLCFMILVLRDKMPKGLNPVGFLILGFLEYAFELLLISALIR